MDVSVQRPTLEEAKAEWEALLADELARRRSLEQWHQQLRDRAIWFEAAGVLPTIELREWIELADAAYSWHVEDRISRGI